MTQKISIGTMKGTGIVATLIVAGLLLKITKASPVMGDIAIFGGIVIALFLGILGVISVLRKVTR